MCPSLPSLLMLQMVKTLVQCSVLTRSRMMSSPSILQKLKLALRPSWCSHSTVSNGSKSFLPRRATATCTSTHLSWHQLSLNTVQWRALTMRKQSFMVRTLNARMATARNFVYGSVTLRMALYCLVIGVVQARLRSRFLSILNQMSWSSKSPWMAMTTQMTWSLMASMMPSSLTFPLD